MHSRLCLAVVGLFLAAAAVANTSGGVQVHEPGPATPNSLQTGDDVSLEVAFEGGDLKNHTYSNVPLGFSVTVPKDWKAVLKSEIKRVLPEVVERNAQAHPERSEQVRDNFKSMAVLFMAAEKKSARGQLSLTIMAVPISEEDRTLTGETLLHQIAESARQRHRADRYFDEPREKTYGGKRLWQSDLQRPQSSSLAFMREVVFVQRGLLVIAMGGAPDRAALDKLEGIYSTLRFFEPKEHRN
ncbi:MAG TPA: hypothetical protein VK525_03245 [Candidatus Saccharimonadales bacterium]|nr:hypothetical protein [Candidatus Saccharimonadales bacterium]